MVDVTSAKHCVESAVRINFLSSTILFDKSLDISRHFGFGRDKGEIAWA
jgi:hypothetical protein